MCEDFRRRKANKHVVAEAVVYSGALPERTSNNRAGLTPSPAEEGHTAVPKGRNVQISCNGVPRTLGAE